MKWAGSLCWWIPILDPKSVLSIYSVHVLYELWVEPHGVQKKPLGTKPLLFIFSLRKRLNNLIRWYIRAIYSPGYSYLRYELVNQLRLFVWFTFLTRRLFVWYREVSGIKGMNRNIWSNFHEMCLICTRKECTCAWCSVAVEVDASRWSSQWRIIMSASTLAFRR